MEIIQNNYGWVIEIGSIIFCFIIILYKILKNRKYRLVDNYIKTKLSSDSIYFIEDVSKNLKINETELRDILKVLGSEDKIYNIKIDAPDYTFFRKS